MKFKEIFTKEQDNIYIDKDTSRWGIDSKVRKFGEKFGELSAVFHTAMNWREGKMSERWCFDISKTEDLRQYRSPGSRYKIMRYVTLTSLSGQMAPLVAINPEKGKIRFLEDYEETSENYGKWGKPLKVQYMRIVK